MNYERCMDKTYPEATDMSMNMKEVKPNMEMSGCCPYPMHQAPMMCGPIMECPQVRCCHRVINYEVPHIIPCHTKMINHHVYRHTYKPCYSYSEENESSEIYEPHCC